jgi:hypothetical protein
MYRSMDVVGAPRVLGGERTVPDEPSPTRTDGKSRGSETATMLDMRGLIRTDQRCP